MIPGRPRPPRRAAPWVLALALALAPLAAAATEPWLPEADERAPDAAPAPATGAGSLRLLLDLGLDHSPRESHANAGLDGRVELGLGPVWQLHAGGRIDWDLRSHQDPSVSRYALTLRELFLRRDAGALTLDAGRMNLRDGVAWGWNPGELVRFGALPVQRTRDPQQLRDSRLGVVALRAALRTGAHEWALVLSPSIGQHEDPSWADPRWGAVNRGRGQVLLKWTPPRWHELYASLLAQRLHDGTRHVALATSQGIGQAVLAYAELARGERPALGDLAAGGAEAGWRTQAALGLSLATEARRTWVAEWQHNGAGVSRGDWRGRWQQAGGAGLVAAFTEAGLGTDPLGRDNLLLALQWDRFGAPRGELTALARLNLVDRSRLGWLEWRYREPATEWALNLSVTEGRARSEFGSTGARWGLGLRWRHYL